MHADSANNLSTVEPEKVEEVVAGNEDFAANASEINSLCARAKMPHLAAHFVENNFSLQEVKKNIFNKIVDHVPVINNKEIIASSHQTPDPYPTAFEIYAKRAKLKNIRGKTI